MLGCDDAGSWVATGAVVTDGNGPVGTGSVLVGEVINRATMAKLATIKRTNNPDRIPMRLSMISTQLALSSERGQNSAKQCGHAATIQWTTA